MTTDSPLNDKTIAEKRAAFQADFELAAAVQDDECLTPEEILALQSGEDLDPVASEHLAHCSLCEAMKQAMRVDRFRAQEFQRAVRQTSPVLVSDMEGREPRTSPFGWRLPLAAMATFASVAMLVLIPKNVAVTPVGNDFMAVRPPAPLQIPNRGGGDSGRGSNQVTIALQPPSGPPMQFVSTAPTTVRDVAPQVATAAVLSKSAITLPVNAPPQLTADVTQEASDIVYGWLTANVKDQASPADSPSVDYLPEQKAYEVRLSGGKASMVIPEVALADGKTMKAQMLTNKLFHHAIASLSAVNHAVKVKLPEGYVVKIDASKPLTPKSAGDQ